jgi:two-component system, OmpR family, phosphate regulon sensor histidine kinase PhoR
MVNIQKENKEHIIELIELNDELENYFQNTIIPQLFVDANLILRKYTPPAMKQFQFTADHIGRPIDELVDNIRFSTLMGNIQEVIDRGEIYEKEIQTTDGLWFQMNIIPYIIQKKNKPNGVIITFVDITERIKDMKELEKLNAAHEMFIYSVSHDLKAPLANIEGLIQSLTTTDYGQSKISAMLDKSVTIMKNIINELSEITKIEGNYKEKIQKVNFHPILREVELILKDKIYESNAQITLNIDQPNIYFSRKNLRSILYNLLSNAIKYKSPHRTPQIVISTELENENIVLSVKDNGLGIEDDKKEFVFSQFKRIETKTEGTGIGLYLVKRIVDNAGGKIIVNSTFGVGSEFKIYLAHNV